MGVNKLRLNFTLSCLTLTMDFEFYCIKSTQFIGESYKNVGLQYLLCVFL